MERQMSKKYLISLLLILCFCYSAKAQNTDELFEGKVLYKVISNKTYDDVLDVVFPREIENKRETVWQLVLRFMPNSEPESQIVIRKTIVGYELIELKSSNGVIFSTLNQWITKNGKEDVLEMAKVIKVEQREVKTNSKVITGWYNIFFESIPLTAQSLKFSSQEFERTNGSIGLRLHGTYYEVWFLYKGNKINFVIYDQEVNDNKITGEYALVKWMNKVRLQIKKKK
jgi:hypothetical protein